MLWVINKEWRLPGRVTASWLKGTGRSTALCVKSSKDSPVTAVERSGFFTMFLFKWSPKLLSVILLWNYWPAETRFFTNLHIWRTLKVNLIMWNYVSLAYFDLTFWWHLQVFVRFWKRVFVYNAVSWIECWKSLQKNIRFTITNSYFYADHRALHFNSTRN